MISCYEVVNKGPRCPSSLCGSYGGYALCFSIFPKVVKTITMGVAYAIWCGAGM